MKIIDTHCHYNLEPLFTQNGGWQENWKEAQLAGVQKSIVVGTSLATTQTALEIATHHPQLFAAAGIHPGEVAELIPPDSTQVKIDQVLTAQVAELKQLITKSASQPIAVGECGLDYFHYQKQYSETTQWSIWKAAQQDLAAAQLKLAAELVLPALLHVRSVDDTAYWDMLALIKNAPHTIPFVLHCASGPLSYITQALELGAYVSIAGNVTYKNADSIRAIVSITPKNRLLVETDAPYLPPVPYRGQTCQPAMIQLTVEYLERELAVDPQQLAQNAETLFGM